MKVFKDIRYIAEQVKNSVVVIGNFDGVHLGHQKLLEDAKKIADTHTLPLIALTFYPHPYKVLRHSSVEFRSIITYEDKIEELSKNKIDYLLIQEFNKEFSLLDSKSFLQGFLLDKLKAKHIIVGENFRFGRDQGDIHSLKLYSKDMDFECTPISLLLDANNIAISSSRIRESLALGNIDIAQSMLGRKYALILKVLKHDQEIAEIYLEDALALKYGEYDATMIDLTSGRTMQVKLSYEALQRASFKSVDKSQIKSGSKVKIILNNHQN